MTRLLVALLVLVVVPIASAASADEPSPQSNADELFRQAREFQQKKQFDRALKLYRASWKLKPTYEVSANMGQLELALGRYRDAAEHISHALARMPPFGEEVTRLRRGLEPSLAIAEKHVAKVIVAVSGTHPKAALEVDGRPLSPWELDIAVYLEPGEHVFTLSGPSYRTVEKKVMAEAGTTQTVYFDPERVRSVRPEAPPGPARGQRTSPTETADASGASLKVPLLVAGGALTAVALGTGIGFAIAAGDSEERAEAISDRIDPDNTNTACSNPPPERAGACAEIRAEHDRKASQYRTANVALLAAGVGAVATLGIWLLWPGDPGPGLLAQVTPVDRGAIGTIGGQF